MPLTKYAIEPLEKETYTKIRCDDSNMVDKDELALKVSENSIFNRGVFEFYNDALERNAKINAARSPYEKAKIYNKFANKHNTSIVDSRPEKVGLAGYDMKTRLRLQRKVPSLSSLARWRLIAGEEAGEFTLSKETKNHMSSITKRYM